MDTLKIFCGYFVSSPTFYYLVKGIFFYSYPYFVRKHTKKNGAYEVCINNINYVCEGEAWKFRIIIIIIIIIRIIIIIIVITIIIIIIMVRSSDAGPPLAPKGEPRLPPWDELPGGWSYPSIHI